MNITIIDWEKSSQLFLPKLKYSSKFKLFRNVNFIKLILSISAVDIEVPNDNETSVITSVKLLDCMINAAVKQKDIANIRIIIYNPKAHIYNT